ncbi:50S ribosomal protein L32 [Parascardovia denticolens IPLA 20019]|uniref:Large ribosomal subunit protein bL32 n=1 Tax=Parascardovia denticolens DSM 10105 = JCM 12538 TaxID=864564 RepID=E6K1T3_PARDN|nr:50S ribosomal protein L32 [Parascardovia denticolens]EFG32294.1 50S ribosomal protein L32 [Parascardovia denticolens F0305]EFT82721.1 ribosomal protein L32 [Parascardovia denticolens DSM 10105 = JCM 12538]EIT89000.1 50S ribosomal protein L32 [Parascardovia denticolens IPLA 20019]BAR04787.1 50S ribosomal protein L32 [Parascardovia denticolens DSM 10105 = JCM 12538]
MALPKYKTSRANTHMRRAAWKAQAAQTVACPNCGAPTLAHMACPNCGSYRGRTYRAAVNPALSAK